MTLDEETFILGKFQKQYIFSCNACCTILYSYELKFKELMHFFYVTEQWH